MTKGQSEECCRDGEDALPAWCSRPFCRSNTQSEPEDYCYSMTEAESSDDELECHKGRPEYYYCSKRNSRGNVVGGGKPLDETGSDGAAGVADAFNDSDVDGTPDAMAGATPPMTLSSELREGFRLVFFVALPMLARQLGSLVSRRLLGRLFARAPM